MESGSIETAFQPAEAARDVRRTLLSSEDVPGMPAYESRLYLIEFPPGAEAKPHVHPTPGLGYVLEGRFESSYDDGSVAITQAGEAFVDRAHQTHHFRNPDADHALRFVISGTFRKGQELFSLVP
jgi:quercetin dioxygenase-like cupin family protein